MAGFEGDVGPPRVSTDERTTLVSFLDYLRDRVVVKLQGLGEDQARRSLVPSGTSLLGLVKHLAVVELGWFRWSFAGEDLDLSPRDVDLVPEDTIASVIAMYRAAVHSARETTAGSFDLDQRAVRSRQLEVEPPSLRWILVHMIEETARHAGHADILREQIDGTVGR